MKMNLKNALKIMGAAEKYATLINVPVVVAISDEGGNTVAVHRMDGACLASIDLAINKAFTAVATKFPTHELGKAAQSDGPLFGINTTNSGRIVIFGGGYPVKEKDEIVGAIGVSGGSVEQDMAIAEAGIKG